VRVRYLRYLLAVGLIAGSLLLLVGCGGGGEQNSQNSQTSETSQYEGSKGEQTAQKQPARSFRTFKGAVTSFLPDKHNLTVKRKNGKAKTFTYKPDKVRIRQDGNKVGPDAIEKGQLVMVNYVRYAKGNNAGKGNIAHSIRIRSKKSGTSSGETSGG
jgi:hypothetical protein